MKRWHGLISVMTLRSPASLSPFGTLMETADQGGQITRQNVNAIYTMDSERCVATVTFAGNQQFEMVITRDGSEGAGIRVDLDGMGLANFTPRFIKRR